MSRASFGETSDNTAMFGGMFVLLAAWAFGGNLLLCALLYQNNLWTLMNRGFMAISLLGIFQSVTCLLPVGISGIKQAWSFSDTWCSSFPFFNSFSQMTVLYFVVFLLLYTIYSLGVVSPSTRCKRATIWGPVLTFILPYILFLPPAMVFSEVHDATQLHEDVENLHACTILLTGYSQSDNYGIFKAFETIFGLVVPYSAIIGLFMYLVFLVARRKSSKKVRVQDVMGNHEKKVSNVYSTGRDNTSPPGARVTTTSLTGLAGDDRRADTQSPVHTKESLSIRSDKNSEVIVYVVSICSILFFAPYIYLRVCEVADPSYPRTGNGLLRFVVHFLSYMVILVYPTMYTIQYPTIKISLVKLDLLNLK